MTAGPTEDEVEPVLGAAFDTACGFFSSIRSRRAATPPADVPAGVLADDGIGALAALDEFWRAHGDRFTGSAGPRYWGFVNGGVTPAALAGDWLAGMLDQNCQLNGDGAAPLIEADALEMLRDLFELPDCFHGTFVTGGSMANFTGLGIALQSLGRRRGVDVSLRGVAALGPVAIVSGEAHSTIAKAASMLGIGRDSVRSVPLLPGREAVDTVAMEATLMRLAGTHSLIVVGNAGTVVTGDFDDLEQLGTLAWRHGAHFHVDGAFGLFARCSRDHRELVRGLEHADTIAADGHKFLNVPIDSGFVFSRELADQVEMFKNVSSYQRAPSLDPQHYIHMSLQNTRRFRGLPVWMTLRAYGRDGHRGIVERSARLARDLGQQVAGDPGFRLLSPVRYNVVCFQVREGERAFSAEENEAFLRYVAEDGRVFVSPGRFGGKPCVRLAIVNWRTTDDDLGLAVHAFRRCRERVLRTG